MELLIVCLSTIIGTIVGVLASVLMMQRKNTLSSKDLEAALKKQLAGAGLAATAASLTVDNLRDLLAGRDQTLQQTQALVAEKQKLVDAATVEVEKAVSDRATAQEKVDELERQVTPLTARVQELEAQLQADRQAADTVRSTNESFETQLQAEKRQVEDLSTQLTTLTAQLDAQKQSSSAGDGLRSSLESELAGARTKMDELTAEVSDLRSELARVEARGHEDRLSAAKGLELLALAQTQFASAFQNGNGHHTPEIPVESEPARLEAAVSG